MLQGGFHALALLTDGDSDGSYIYLGSLILRGELGLYDASMTGHRTPGPYYLIGLSQVLFGPSVLAGRLFSLLAGWAGVLILWRTARRSLGEPAGTLALLLLAANAYLMSHFAVAAFHGLAFFWVALGAWYLVASDSPWRRALVVLCAWGLFLTRPQFGLVIPLAAAWAVWTAKTPQARRAGLVAAILPGVAQLDWAVQLAREAFPIPSRFLRMEALKFQRVARPGDTIHLELEWQAERCTLQFRYTSVHGPHASGRVVFDDGE